MGWMRTFLLGDVGNRLDIGDVEVDVENLRRYLRRKSTLDQRQSELLAELRRENEVLAVSLCGLLRLLLNKGVLSRAELEAFAQLVDPEELEEGS